MKKLLATAAVAAVVAFQAPAKAAVIITVLAPGVTSIAAPTENFDTRSLGPAVGGPAFDGGMYSGFGQITIGSVSTSAAPFYGPAYPGDQRDPTNYLTIGPNGPETITYASPKDFFGLYWGSVDKYNTVDFYLGANPVGSFTGSNIVPLLPIGDQNDFHSNRYVVFSNLVFDKVVLGSSGIPAFEIDSVAAGAPEPATWALMLLGFAGIGFVAYRRTKKISAAVAA
jgi:PEP-CTERM motif